MRSKGERSGGGRARDRPQGDRREQILDAALELCAVSGSLGTSVAAVAASVGISDAGVLHHFKTKQELLIAALEHVDRRVESDIESSGAAFATAARDGDLRADLDPVQEASSLFAHLDGIRMQWFLVDSTVSMADSVRAYVDSTCQRLSPEATDSISRPLERRSRRQLRVRRPFGCSGDVECGSVGRTRLEAPADRQHPNVTPDLAAWATPIGARDSVRAPRSGSGRGLVLVRARSSRGGFECGQ